MIYITSIVRGLLIVRPLYVSVNSNNFSIVNLNASLYANAQSGIQKEFGVSSMAAVSGSAIFLVTYAFGCELYGFPLLLALVFARCS